MKRSFALILVSLLFVSVLSVSLISADFFGSWFDENSGIKITGQVTGNVVSGCVDSDNGKNYFAKGTTSGIDAKTGSQTSQTDRCVNRRTLIEYFCDNDGKVAGYFNTCSSGCSAGICRGTAPRTTITATAPPTTPSMAQKSTNQQDYDDEIVINPILPKSTLLSKILSVSSTKSVSISDSLCKPLLVNGNPSDKLDIVILPDGYLSDSELKDFVSTAREYLGLTGSVGLLNTEPFKSNKNKLNIYYVNYSGSLGGCYIGSTTPCDAVKIQELKSLCPSDEVILIFNPDAYTDLPQRSFASTCNHFASVIGHTTKYQYIFNPNTLLHEFGHSFGCLRDLYYTSSYSETHPETYANLDQYACPKWCSGTPVIPRPNNQICQTITSESECKNADVFPKCVWQVIGGFCEALGIDYACNAYNRDFGGDESSCSGAYSGILGIQCEMNLQGLCLFKGESVYGEHFVNLGEQCQQGYGCYQGAEGFYSYSAEPSRNTIMGYMNELRYDIASYEHLVDLLSKYPDNVYPGIQKTCEQTRTLKRQTSLNRCAADEQRDSATMRAYSQCRRTFFGRCFSRATYYNYDCVKTTTTACSADAACLTGSIEKSSVAC